VDDRYVLIVPTYANNRGERAVPAAVIRFLNSEENRMHLVGVIGSGNKNFGNHFALAANVISAKTGHPVLYKYELLGTDFDVREVEQILRNQHATRPN
jgi:protein involved in ribonucleotide reduction